MSKTVKVGFVGTGGIASHNHLPALSKIEGVQIQALCDVVESRAKAAADKFGGKIYTDYRKMLSEEDLDALYVCVPPFAHQDAEIIAAQKKVHLFVEKPVVLNLDKGVEISEAIKKSGVISSVGYGSRYSAAADAVRSFLKDRAIGMVACDRWGGVAGDASHWWRVMDKSGGMLHEQATHQLDLIRYFAGDIVEVYAKHARKINFALENFTIPDAEVVVLQFENGAIGYISTNCSLIKGAGQGRMDFIIEGHILLRYGRQELQLLPEGSGTIMVSPEPVPSIDQAFISAIQNGDKTLIRSPYNDALKTAAVTIATLQSAKENRPIQVPKV